MKLVTTALVAWVAFLQVNTAHAIPQRGEQMLANLAVVKSVFYATYAPAKWKREFANWSLDEEIAKIERRIRAGEITKVKDFQRALAGFFNSTRDYHVSVRFQAKETALLPFQVKGAEDRFYLVHVDREKLPLTRFPFREGDELVRFGGHPTLEVIRAMEANESAGNPETQRALAELTLTIRRAAYGLEVPRGKVQLAFQRKGEAQATPVELDWEYTPESAAFLFDNTDPLNNAPMPLERVAEDSRASIERLFKRRMAAPSSLNIPHAADNRFAVGALKSYVPDLGEKVFEYDQGFFHVRVFRVEGGKTIGLLRIPSYEGDAPQTREFLQLIKMLEQRTDALVIDQVSNPGGSVPFMYSLLSALTTRPLTAPLHHMGLTQGDVVDAENTRASLAQISDDATAREMIGDTIGGYPVTQALVRRLADYSDFIIREWSAGKRYTDPFYLVGVDKVEPNPEVRYTKPLLVLVDNLDFSGGDFFPAVLQDNRRAKILGTRTAGAGGYVVSVKVTNLMGIDSFALTGSLAERIDRRPIENLGVTPDVVYRLTKNDLQGEMAEFRRAILAALRQ